MQHIIWSIKKTLQKKEYNNHIIARLALTEAEKYFNIQNLQWYLRYHILYIQLSEQSDIIKLFHNKKSILELLNTSLEKYNYPLIKDIRHKKIPHTYN